MKATICDICGKKINYIERYEFKKAKRFMFDSHYMGEIDVCRYCADTVKELSLKRRKDESNHNT